MDKIIRKSLLYKSEVEYADYCINHVEGCAHGCKYPCYAMMLAKRFGKIKNYDDWIKPKIVENALELLDKEIPKYKNDIKFVQLCFMTDPFMYKYKEVSELSLDIIRKLNKNGIKCTALTKGILPKELIKDDFLEINEYGITLVSLNEEFRNRVEPGSAPYLDRIKALKYLSNKGLKTWVSMEPYPTPNMVEQDLLKILEKLSFADKIIFGRLNYNSQVTQYKNYQKFYNDCTDLVIEFCKQRNIDYHIKEGTKTNYEEKTEDLFSKKEKVKTIFRLPHNVNSPLVMCNPN